MNSNFVHFRVLSSYSFLESALHIEQIVDSACNYNMKAVCLSDRANLFGSLEFSIKACNSNIQPIHGILLNILLPWTKGLSKNDFVEILLIAKDDIGYKNLLKLNSFIFIKNSRKICDHITFSDLFDCNEGLIYLSGYIYGIIGVLLLSNKIDVANQWIKKIKNVFGNRFYFEIMRHGLEKENLIENIYINLSIENQIPLIATNQVLFINNDMYDAHDVLSCIAQGVTRENINRQTISNQCYFKSAEEMQKNFSDIPESIYNSVYLSERCYVKATSKSLMLPKFNDLEFSKLNILIKKESNIGLSRRLENKFKLEQTSLNQQIIIKTEYLKRLEYELDIICNMNFSGYFLIVSDLIIWSKENSIPVGPGRGSGAGSIVAWSLYITDVDPIKFGLLFERFLNPERISMPDFDIDFCQERREEVISYVRSKYGKTRVGQIITFGKLQAKAVIKDVSRVLGLPYNYANYITNLIPFNAISPVTLKQAISDIPELNSAFSGSGLYELDGNKNLIQDVIKIALSLEGLHRHASIHAAGIVISSVDLVDLVPVYQDINSDLLVVQYSMKYVELAGLIKFDFLGLQTLTLIKQCLELIKTQNITVNFNLDINFSDKDTYKMLSSGESLGVFQLESVGMQDFLRRLKPDSIEDIIALCSLYRPGPMENISTYIACKHNKQQPNYMHNLLIPILKETYGVIIYQEQVLEIAKVLANYSLGNADLLRRAMGKKNQLEMESQHEKFISGAKLNKIPIQQATQIFTTVAKFAGYGFNKAHATAYAILSYYTAYLKTHFIVEFLVSNLNLEINNNEKLIFFIYEAKKNKINIIYPDINTSLGFFSVSFDKSYSCKSILYGLGAIKNITVNFGAMIEQERVKNGDFISIVDFVERISYKYLNRKTLEHLIKAGCFDKLHNNRSKLLHNLDKLIAYSISYDNEKNTNQFSLVSIKSSTDNIIESFEKSYSNIELSYYEFDALGYFIKIHPLMSYKNLFIKLNIINTKILYNNFTNTDVIKIAGVVQKKDFRMSYKRRFIHVYFSDIYGLFEITIFNEDIIKHFAHLLNVSNIVIAYCIVTKDNFGNVRLTAKHFSNINNVFLYEKFTLKLLISDYSVLESLVQFLHSRITKESNNIKIIIFFRIYKNCLSQILLPDFFKINNCDLEFLDQFIF